MTISMKKIIVRVSVLVFAFGSIFANTESMGVFPLSDITIGMSSKALLEKYPATEILFESKTDDQILTEGIVIYEFTTNKFWDALWIGIDNSKVKTLHYLKDEGNNSAVKNIKPLFDQLKQQLGGTFEKGVTYGETEKTRCAIYIWKRGKDVMVFIHSPVSQYKNGDISFYQLTIARKVEDMGALYENMATDNLPEDALLWADAMGEETVAFPSRWVYACAAFCVLFAIAYLIRRKR